MQRQHRFQATIGPRPGGFPSVRNPWVDKHGDSSSSSASRSGRSGYPRRHQPIINPPGPPPASEWLRPTRYQYPPVPAANPGPSVHSSSPGVSAISGGIGGGGGYSDSCGGQCAGYDAFFYHCLQVIYIAGILTGISLMIAGSVLRGSPRKGDLIVLVYIGFLLAAVCAVLLSVHYCVRRNVKERKRTLRLARMQTRPPVTPTEQHVTILHHDFPTEEIEMTDFRHSMPRRGSSRSRSNPPHSRRYYKPEAPEHRPVEEWERQPYQPLIHRPLQHS